MKLGFYKICFKLKDDIKDDLNPNQNWFESGVLISTQDAVSSLSINGIIEVEATVAKRAGKFFAPLLPTSLISVRFRMPSHAPPVLTFQFHFLGFGTGNTISLCKNYDCTAKFGPPVSGSRVVDSYAFSPLFFLACIQSVH